MPEKSELLWNAKSQDLTSRKGQRHQRLRPISYALNTSANLYSWLAGAINRSKGNLLHPESKEESDKDNRTSSRCETAESYSISKSEQSLSTYDKIESGTESINGNLSSQNLEARECRESDRLCVHESSRSDKFGVDSHKESDEVINIALEASHHAEELPEKNRCIPEDKLYLFLDYLLDLKLLLRQHSVIIENMITKSTTLSSDMMREMGEDILNFNVPSIVAIGAQSTGKSSLLESIITRDILPKGNGLITRCPIVINIVPHHQKKSQNEVEICQETEWAEIGQEKQIISNINDLKSAIELEMSRNYEANPNMNSTFMRGESLECNAVDESVTRMPLKVKIFSNIMPPLCIIDLPGLIKVPNKGQPDNIEQITFRICQDYIRNPNSIILALSPGTMDLQTSESLKMAEKFDPEGERTIAVITKLDLLAQDSNDHEILEKYFKAQNLKWRPKIVGCICRSKLDCPKSEDIYGNNRKLEKKLMEMLDKSLQKRIGIENLVNILDNKLNIMVHKSLNNIMQFIETLLSEMLKKSDFTALDPSDKQYRLIQKIDDFSVIFERIVEGNDPSLIELNSNGKEVLRGGSAIYNILHRDFFQQISKIDSLKGITKQYLEKTIVRSAGINPRLFLPENALTNLARQQLRQLQSPCFNMIDKIRNEIHKTIQMTYNQTDIKNYPLLFGKMNEVINKKIEEKYNKTKDLMKTLLEIEQNYINVNYRDYRTSNFDYLDMLFSLQNSKDRNVALQQSSPNKTKQLPVISNRSSDAEHAIQQSEKYTVMLERLLKDYIDAIKYKFHDSAIKTVMHCFINALRKELRVSINSAVVFLDAESLLVESEELREEHSAIEAICERLNNIKALFL